MAKKYKNIKTLEHKNKRLILLCFYVFMFLCFYAPAALAQQPAAYPDIKINIGGFTGEEFKTQGWESTACSGNNSQDCLSLNWIGQYIGVVYRYGVGLAAVLAAIMIMVGGFLWLASAGNPSQISKGKEFIISALTGLVLALFSFLILQTINPRLVALEPVSVTVPSTQGYDTTVRETVGDGGESEPAPTDAQEYTKAKEGFRATRYNDTEGNPTIGYGHKITGQEVPPIAEPMTEEQAEILFSHDYQQAEIIARQAVPQLDNSDFVNDVRRTAIIDMAYNMGSLNEFTGLQTAINNNDWDRAAEEVLWKNPDNHNEGRTDYYNAVPARAQENANLIRSGG